MTDDLTNRGLQLAAEMEQGLFHRLEGAAVIRDLVKRNGELEGQVRTAANEINDAYRSATQARERLAQLEHDLAGWPQPRLQLMRAIAAELDYAYRRHGRAPWNRHEFYAVLLEEVDELWEAVKADLDQDAVLAELIQVAAMCFRYVETDDRDRGFHVWPDVRGQQVTR